MKKILFFVNNLSGGGAERVMAILSNKLNDKNEVIVYSVKNTENLYNIDSKIKINYLFTNEDKKNKFNRIKKMREAIKKEKPDTIISFEYFINLSVIIANLFLKNRLVISERNDPASVGNDKKNIRNLLYSFSDCLVCQTEDAKNYFPKRIQKKSVVIPNPIKAELPEPYKGKREKIIVNFCRLEKQKNIPLLIDSFEIVHKKYNDYNLIIYGNGTLKEEIQNYIEEKKLSNCIKLEPFSNSIHQDIIKSSMFVSSSDYEGISNSMLESMALGIPTICTDCPCGGARMMITNRENGLLVPVRDSILLANAMLEVIENNELAEKISINAIKIRETLKEDVICDEWQKIL